MLCRKPLGRLRRSICMTMSKSPRRVLQVAYDAACRALPAHRHKFSPKKFTQPQLVACLVLKEFLRLDYRGLAAHLADHPDLTRLHRPEGRPPLHHLPEGRPHGCSWRPRPAHVRRRARAGAAGQGPQAAGPPGGRRRHRDGVAARQPLLRQAAVQDRKWHPGDDLRQVPQGRPGHRLPEPHGAGGGPRPGSRLGPGAVQGGAQGRRPGGRGSGRCWPTPTTTPSGSTSTSGTRTASGRSSRRSAGVRRRSRRRGDGVAG